MQTTLPLIYHDLMKSPSVILDHCAICGRPTPLNNHHMVFRSAGELIKDGKKLEKPLITLCGFGNNLKDADGRYYCHGLAHHRMLHFRHTTQLEYLLTDEPCRYDEALSMPGWKAVRYD